MEMVVLYFGNYAMFMVDTIVQLNNKLVILCGNGSVQDRERRRYARTGRSEENIAAVSDSVADDPNMSISRRSQQL